MKASIDDYQSALDSFVEMVRGMGDDVVSALLCGSLARGDVLAGKSDILDAFIFLRAEVFEDRERFLSLLEKMVVECERLSQMGLPFHPFYYWSEDETIPAIILENLKSTRETIILAGKDIRPELTDSAASRMAAKWALFEARQKGWAMVLYLDKEELSTQERRLIMSSLVQVQKYFPSLACHALDLYPSYQDSYRQLEQALPGVNSAVLDKIKSLRCQSEESISVKELRNVLRETVTYIETLTEAVMLKIEENGGLKLFESRHSNT
jgi:hypothetical protein